MTNATINDISNEKLVRRYQDGENNFEVILTRTEGRFMRFQIQRIREGRVASQRGRRSRREAIEVFNDFIQQEERLNRN